MLHVKIGLEQVTSLSWRHLEDAENEHLKYVELQFGHLMFQPLPAVMTRYDECSVQVMTRSATYRVERPTSSVFASGALSSARTRWELKQLIRNSLANVGEW